MSEYVKSFIAPLLVSAMVSMGGSALASAVLIGKLEERVSISETHITRQEERIEYLRTRTEDQERQLARFEATLNDIAEIKSDVKILMRAIPK